MKTGVIVRALTVASLMTILSTALIAQDLDSGHGKPEPRTAEPPRAGIHWARGEKPEAPGNGQGAAGRGKPVKSPNLTWHGGPVMHDMEVTPIFWGKRWSEAAFVAKTTGLIDFYASIGNTLYAKTNSEYVDPIGHVSPAVRYMGSMIDLSAAPSNGNLTSPILAEVCKMIAAPVSKGCYPVYTDTPRGSAGFCAWHSFSTCGGVPVQFAFFFNLDDDAGCDPQDNATGHSQGLAAVANVSGHELSEALTDPQLNAWFDGSGEENSDKCAWSFGSAYVTFAVGSNWKIQGNWSNNAYDAGTGYANRSGQNGCIDH